MCKAQASRNTTRMSTRNLRTRIIFMAAQASGLGGVVLDARSTDSPQLGTKPATTHGSRSIWRTSNYQLGGCSQTRTSWRTPATKAPALQGISGGGQRPSLVKLVAVVTGNAEMDEGLRDGDHTHWACR